jgi:CRP-like cAMP-binding protein
MAVGSAPRLQLVTPPGSNTLLRALSREALGLLCPHLEYIELPFHEVLRPADHQDAQFVYFLNGGLLSLLIETASGKSAEIAVIGKEGMTSSAAALGAARSPIREVMQIAGNGFRVSAEAMYRAIQQSSELRGIVTRYSTLLTLQIAQIAGCNRVHSAEQRLARWLLMAHDRVAMNPLPLTQEFVALLLGITRPSVSATANALKKKGTIELRRQKVHILSREKLEESSCECYRVIAGLGLA